MPPGDGVVVAGMIVHDVAPALSFQRYARGRAFRLGCSGPSVLSVQT
jgi:hypothetical protein